MRWLSAGMDGRHINAGYRISANRGYAASMKSLAPLLLLISLAGCVGTAAHIVTAPVRAASWTVDKATTSRSEADRNRGRRERKAEKRQAKAARKAARDESSPDR